MGAVTKTPFRPRARLLQLLGDQLIRSPRLAVFELVKNAYDADARIVEITIDKLGTEGPEISVLDDGVGMTVDTVRDIWFVPGHDHKQIQKLGNETTALGRSPMGEKGVGRFAAHKLGNRIELVTRYVNRDEVHLLIDWQALLQKEFLEDAIVSIEERKPEVFKEGKTGTLIKISELSDKNWSRGDLRRLYRDITSICSPFGGPVRRQG